MMTRGRLQRRSLQSWGPTVVDASSGSVDLIVVGSQAGAPKGHVVVAGEVRNELNSARSSVLVLPAESRIEF